MASINTLNRFLVDWIQYPTPEAEVVELVGAKAWVEGAYVRTADQQIYFCELDEGCEVSDLGEIRPLEEWCQADFATPPSQPGPPVDTYLAKFCSDSSTQLNIVLLEDGTVWGWEYRRDWGAGLVAWFARIVGAIFVFLVGIIWIILGYRAERKRLDPAARSAIQ